MGGPAVTNATNRGTAEPSGGETDGGGRTALGRALDRRSETVRRLRSVVLGLTGGAFATLVMTVFRMPITDSLPPTAAFLARYGGGDPEDYLWSSFVLHFVYGVGGGGLFGLLISEGGGSTRAEIELRDIAFGLVYSLVFSLFGSRIVLDRVVGMDLESDEALIFHVGHAIYGLALGAWIGSKR